MVVTPPIHPAQMTVEELEGFQIPACGVDALEKARESRLAVHPFHGKERRQHHVTARHAGLETSVDVRVTHD
jgi:hypothetical protein